MEVARWREELRKRALSLALEAAAQIHGTVFLVGSYARGDFGEDSDVDLLVIAHFTEPPHRRLLHLTLPVEVIALTPEEAIVAVEKCYPIAYDIALGIVLKDELSIADMLIQKARRCSAGKSYKEG